MNTRVQSWFSGGLAHLPSLLTFIGLMALLIVGHRYDWKLPGAKDDENDDDKSAEAKSEKELGRPQVTSGPSIASSRDSSKQLHQIEFPSEEAVKRAGLKTVPVMVRSLPEEIVANGVLEFDRTHYAHLASRASGTVWAVPRKTGDRVQAGEALVLVDSVEVGKAKAELSQSLVQYELKRQVLDRMRIGDGVVPERQLREAEAAFRESRVKLLHDRQALANLGMPTRLEDLAGLTDDQVFQRLRVLGLPEPYSKEVENSAGSAGLVALLAPFAGEIIRSHAARGEIVGPSQPLIVIAATDPLWVMLDVRQEDVARLRTGQSVDFQADNAGGEKATGILAWISAEADPKTRTVRVRASLPNPAGRLRPNTFGTGRILVREQPKAMLVPAQAVHADGKDHLVFVRKGPTVFRVRKVEVGLRDGQLVQIRSGIDAEEEVVTTGSHALMGELHKDLIVDND